LNTTLRSQSSHDGWVLESTGTSNTGGSLNATATAFRLGDHAAEKQYVSLLSFNTSALPDGAVITKVTLKLKLSSVVSTNPLSTHSSLRVDVRSGYFGSSASLPLGDFQASASQSGVGNVPNGAVSGWYAGTSTSGILDYIDKTGLTQLGLRFRSADNDDRGADYLSFYSGNATSAYRPRLIIEYHVP
jgi:hypothetical protein